MDEMPRFSDQQLVQLREDFNQFKREQQQQADALSEALREQAAAIADLAQSTAGVVQLYSDMQAATRLGSGVQAFLLWCVKWGVITSGLAYGVRWLLEHFTPPGHP